ncbi:hypothetical protein IWQ61_006805 [Dispira simplex]|nr:hypothetical protein IWQ61_006805 [Dispira simplex]
MASDSLSATATAPTAPSQRTSKSTQGDAPPPVEDPDGELAQYHELLVNILRDFNSRFTNRKRPFFPDTVATLCKNSRSFLKLLGHVLQYKPDIVNYVPSLRASADPSTSDSPGSPSNGKTAETPHSTGGNVLTRQLLQYTSFVLRDPGLESIHGLVCTGLITFLDTLAQSGDGFVRCTTVWRTVIHQLEEVVRYYCHYHLDQISQRKLCQQREVLCTFSVLVGSETITVILADREELEMFLINMLTLVNVFPLDKSQNPWEGTPQSTFSHNLTTVVFSPAPHIKIWAVLSEVGPVTHLPLLHALLTYTFACVTFTSSDPVCLLPSVARLATTQAIGLDKYLMTGDVDNSIATSDLYLANESMGCLFRTIQCLLLHPVTHPMLISLRHHFNQTDLPDGQPLAQGWRVRMRFVVFALAAQYSADPVEMIHYNSAEKRKRDPESSSSPESSRSTPTMTIAKRTRGITSVTTPANGQFDETHPAGGMTTQTATIVPMDHGNIRLTKLYDTAHLILANDAIEIFPDTIRHFNTYTEAIMDITAVSPLNVPFSLISQFIHAWLWLARRLLSSHPDTAIDRTHLHRGAQCILRALVQIVVCRVHESDSTFPSLVTNLLLMPFLGAAEFRPMLPKDTPWMTVYFSKDYATFRQHPESLPKLPTSGSTDHTVAADERFWDQLHIFGTLQPLVLAVIQVMPPMWTTWFQLASFRWALQRVAETSELRKAAWRYFPVFVSKYHEEIDVLRKLHPSLELHPDDTLDILAEAVRSLRFLACAYSGHLAVRYTHNTSSTANCWYLICNQCNVRGQTTVTCAPFIGDGVPGLITGMTTKSNTLWTVTTNAGRPILLNLWVRYWFLISQRQEPQLRIGMARALASFLHHAPPGQLSLGEDTLASSLADPPQPELVLANHRDDDPLVMTQGVLRYLSTSLRGLRQALGQALHVLAKVPIPTESAQPIHLVNNLRQQNQQTIVKHLIDMLDVAAPDVVLDLMALLGPLGQVCEDPGLLGHVLKLFLEHMMTPNLLIRSVILKQLVAIARSRQSTVAALFRPYLPALSVYLVQCWAAHRGTTSEAIQLLGNTPHAFFNATLDYTLPELVAMQREDILVALGRELEQELPVLCVNHAHTILAHLFVLSSTALQQSVRLYLGIVTKDFRTITLSHILRSCALQLIIQLTERLGDSDPAKSQRASRAIGMVLKKLRGPLGAQLSDHEDSPSTTLELAMGGEQSLYVLGKSGSAWATLEVPLTQVLLRKYFLGILTHINEVLSTDCPATDELLHKRTTLRGLTGLMKLVGRPIRTVSTHIGATLNACLAHSDLQDATLEAWYALVLSVTKGAFGAYLSHVVAILGWNYKACNSCQQELIRKILDYLLVDNERVLATEVRRLCLLPEDVVEFEPYNGAIWRARGTLTISEHLTLLTDILHEENLHVVEFGLVELQGALERYRTDIYRLVVGEQVDPSIVRLVSGLLRRCVRTGSRFARVAHLSAMCLGQLGAIDPTRLAMLSTTVSSPTPSSTEKLDHLNDPMRAPRFTLFDFGLAEGRLDFMCHLLEYYLIPSFRTAKTPQEQGYTAFAIQEILKLGGFSTALLDDHTLSDRGDGHSDPDDDPDNEILVVPLTRRTQSVSQSSLPPTLITSRESRSFSDTPGEFDETVRKRWRRFPPLVRDTLTTLLDTKYSLHMATLSSVPYPIFANQTEHRYWLKMWVLDLVGRLESGTLATVLGVCRNVIRYEEDHQLALFLLPYLVLELLSAGQPAHTDCILNEFHSVLRAGTPHLVDHYFYSCAHTLFQVLDQLTQWKYQQRPVIQKKSGKSTSARKAAMSRSSSASSTSTAPAGAGTTVEDQTQRLWAKLTQVDQRLQSIPHRLLAEASYYCRADARALLHLEAMVHGYAKPWTQPEAVEALQTVLKVYDRLGEPDGVQGVSTLLPHVETDQQLLLFESTSQWVSAQACYELKLKQLSESLTAQLGFINCLKHLGHLESMLTHIRGLLSQYPQWHEALQPSAVEAAWRLSKWDVLETVLDDHEESDASLLDAVETSVSVTAGERTDRAQILLHSQTFEIALGRLLLTLRQENHRGFQRLLDTTRTRILVDLAVTGQDSYTRGYSHLVQLHMLQELEKANAVWSIKDQPSAALPRLEILFKEWDHRLEITMPVFQIREPILNLRRVLVQLVTDTHRHQPEWSPVCTLAEEEYGRMWLVTAKTARKEKYFQTAFGAILHATEVKGGMAFIEQAKWYWHNGQHRLAIVELQHALDRYSQQHPDHFPNGGGGTQAQVGSTVADQLSIYPGLSLDVKADRFLLAKANLLLTKWLATTNSSNSNTILVKYDQVAGLQPRWEKAYFLIGRYYNKFLDSIRQRDLAAGLTDSTGSGSTSHGRTDVIVYLICRNYGKALTCGNKYIYQTLPRLLTIWLNFGAEVDSHQRSTFPSKAGEERLRYLTKINNLIQNMVKRLPTYQFLTAFSQIISRICHPNPQVFAILEHIIISVLIVFPHQALWSMMAVLKSTVRQRSSRCQAIFAKVRSDPTAMLKRVHVDDLIQQATKLTDCLLQLCNFPVPPRTTALSVHKDFRSLVRMTPLQLIIPLQRSLTVTLPTSSQALVAHNPFPGALPTIHAFADTIEVMHSLQKPKKVTMVGSDGARYTFLCKPKDDLRKDSRTMEFNAMINKLLCKDTESRRRQLEIRTYAVIPLNEDCGLIEWVPHTTGYRHIILHNYQRKNITVPLTQIRGILERKELDPAELFLSVLLPKFPPVFHEWFLEQFPDPSHWFSNRRRYVRTTAVMSMVGYILGLGDRHGENILLDETSGDIVHVDFSCLFEKGLTLEKPELVPFRLTHNMVRAMGITGYEGVFRRTCEVTMGLLRTHRDSLMCVLETFIHDPLCEWSRQRSLFTTSSTKHDRHSMAGGGQGDQGTGELQNKLALNNLSNIKKKLDGWAKNSIPMSVEGQVDELVRQATNPADLFKMYIGWAAYL